MEEKIDKILLANFKEGDWQEARKQLLLLFSVMQRSEQLVCDKCVDGLNKSKHFEKGTCVHCRGKVKQTNCA